MIVLGLDVSTSNVGMCVLQTSKEATALLHAEGLSLTKVKGLIPKAMAFKQAAIKLKNDLSRQGYKVTAVVVEEPLQAFRSRMSSAGTIATLNRFNGMVSFIASELFGLEAQMANVVSIRKQVGLKLDKKSDKNTKEQVFDWVSQNYVMEEFTWPTKVLKSGPNKGLTRFDTCCYDIADAFVVAYSTCLAAAIEKA